MESKIQAKILKYLRTVAWAVKVVQATKRGCPDILCCYKGRFYAFAVKQPSCTATVIQQWQIAAIHKHGGKANVVCSVDEVKTILKG